MNDFDQLVSRVVGGGEPSAAEIRETIEAAGKSPQEFADACWRESERRDADGASGPEPGGETG